MISGVLAVLTGVYVVLTGRLVRAARESAAAAVEAAQASSQAAQASHRAATLAEAALAVDFDVDVERHADGEVWFAVTCNTANIVMHGATLRCTVVTDDGKRMRVEGASLELPHGGAFPRFLHMGEMLSLRWPSPVYRQADPGIFGFVEPVYSFTSDGDQRRRVVYFEKPAGIGDAELKAAGMRES